MAEQHNCGLVRLEDGKGLKPAHIPDGLTGQIRWTIGGDTITLLDDNVRIAGTIKLEDAGNPKRIDIVLAKPEGTGRDLLYGIYKLEGEMLSCCFGLAQHSDGQGRHQRPAGFETHPGSGLRLNTLRREAKQPERKANSADGLQ